MTKQEQITKEFNELRETMESFIRLCPAFPEEKEKVKAIGRAMANVETTLHWKFECWELGLPHL